MARSSIGIILSILLVTQFRVKAFDFQFDDLKEPAVGIAVVATGIISGAVMYVVGSRSAEAKRLKEERLLAQQKDERDKQERLDGAKKFLFMMQSRYVHELGALDSGRKLTKEELVECAVVEFSHKTPFVHLTYSRQLRDDIKEFNSYYCDFSEGDRPYIEEMRESLTKVLNQHSILFRNVLSSELSDEKIALEEERKRENSRNIEREKLQQEILRRECFEKLKKDQEAFAQKVDKSLTAVTNYSLEKMNEMATYVSAVHVNNLAAHSRILQDLQAEFKNNGLTSKTNSIEKQIMQLNKNVAEGSRESKKITEIFEIHRNQLNQIKNEINTLRNENRLSKEQIDRMNKIIERAESTLAVISSDVGDIKSGNSAGTMTAPVKESHW